MFEFNHFTRIRLRLALLLSLLLICIFPSQTYATAFTFDKPVETAENDRDLASEVRADQSNLDELQNELPKFEDRVLDEVIKDMHIEHTLTLGPGFRSNTDALEGGEPSWIINFQSKHLFTPGHNPTDTIKWAVLFGTQLEWVESRDESTFHVLFKAPKELYLGKVVQIRSIQTFELKRPMRWDFEPDLPYLETKATYFNIDSQHYLQLRIAEWFHLRLGLPIQYRRSVTSVFQALGTTIPNDSAFFAIGGGVELHLPFSKRFRMTVGGASLKRKFDKLPLISEGPLAFTALKLEQDHVRGSVEAEVHFSDISYARISGTAHRFTSNETAYDFNAFALEAELHIKLGTVWVIPEAKIFTREFANLTYQDDATPTGFTEVIKSEQFSSIGVRIAWEHHPPNFKPFYIAAQFKFHSLNNEFPGNFATSLEKLHEVSFVDFFLHFALYL